MPPTLPDAERLEALLAVLANARRIELLGQLREAKTLDEIHLTPGKVQSGERPQRPLTRQAVKNHLDLLMEVGLVRVRPTDRKGGRIVQEFVADQPQLFAVLEDMRRLVSPPSPDEAQAFATQAVTAGPQGSWEEGAKVIIVHGVREGTAFPLRRSALRAGRGWVLGRSKDADVSLAYDPYVSKENAEILPDKDGFRLLDLRTAKNGTFLNWRRLPLGGEARLQGGDVIGVGRSLLVFRPQ